MKNDNVKSEDFNKLFNLQYVILIFDIYTLNLFFTSLRYFYLIQCIHQIA